MIFLNLIPILVFLEGFLASLNEVTDVRYASHVYEPGLLEPKLQLKREPSEEKNIESKSDLKDFLIEGDILIQFNRSKRNKRKIVNEINLKLNQPTRWPQRIIPFEFATKFPQDMISLFQQAVDHWHQYTCLRFEPFDPNKHRQHRSRLYVEFSNICGSLIGYNFDKRQKLSKTNVYLGRVCSLGNIIHELGHAIGFRHEQSRSDRDAHIRINFKNLKPDFATQYYAMTDSQPGYYGIPYDLSSIMHYGSGGGTISALDQNRNFLMGQRKGLSFLDIQMANLAYKCHEKCDEIIECQNGGFIDQFCKCFCPEGTEGTYCEKIKSDIDYKQLAIKVEELEEAISCNFGENNLCQWTNDKARSTQDWIFNRPELNGFTETQHYFSKTKVKLGPQNGDRFGNKKSSYIYLNSVRKSGPNSNAILSSPPITVNTHYPICLKFWYNMYQSTINHGYSIKIGSLNVSLRLVNGKSITVWKKEGNQGLDWKYQELDIVLEPPVSSINFEAQLDGVNYGDLCIDDISLIKGKCREELIFGDWSNWSNCSSKCGKGTQTRTRSCSYSDGTKNFDLCSKISSEIRDCVGQNCDEIKSDTNRSFFSSWSIWSSCTDGCFSFKKRYRTCINSHLGNCVGKKTEISVCSNCKSKSKRNILYKQLIKMFKNSSESENDEDSLSEWSEWSSCYAMKNECDPGIQIRIKTCLKKHCKDVPKEVRKCEESNDADLRNFCSNNSTKLDFSLNFANKNLNSNLTQIFNVIDLSKSSKLKSFVIDINQLKNNDRINFTLFSSKNLNSNKTLCFHMFVVNQIQHEISFLNLHSNEKFYRRKMNDKKLNHFYLEIFKSDTVSNLTADVLLELKRKIIPGLDGLTAPIYFKSLFLSEGICLENLEEKIDHANEITVDIDFSANEQIANIFNWDILNSFDNNVARFRQTNYGRCGGIFDLTISKKMTISSPSYPYEYPTSANCIYLIKSPVGTKIQLRVLDLDLRKTSLNFCLDSLELRYYHLGQPGPIYCGTFTHQNQLELISYKNMVMIIFKSDWIQASNRRGFRLIAQYGFF